MTKFLLDEPTLNGFSVKKTDEITLVRMVSRHPEEYHIKYFFEIPTSTLSLFLQLKDHVNMI